MEDKKDKSNRDLKYYSHDEIISIINKYKNHENLTGMEAFLKKAASCRKCETLADESQEDDDRRFERVPLNRLVSPIDFNVTSSDLAIAIENHYKNFRNFFNRKYYEPISNFEILEGSNAEFHDYVMNRFFPERQGLSIGVCGWTDASMLRSKEKPEIMIIGADWYPLRSQPTFLIERDDESFLNPGGFLRKLLPAIPHEQFAEAWKDLLSKHGVYFTNAMLCYRPQSAKVGNRNIAPESFLYCQEHLEAQIRIISPKLIITWGLQPALSMLRYVSKLSSENDTTIKLKRLFTDGFKFRKLAEVGFSAPFKLMAEWGEFHFHPLCHPSMPNRWGKDANGLFHDYADLKKWLVEKNMLNQR